MPVAVSVVASRFASAYASHDAADGGDDSYAAAGLRAAAYATGDLALSLPQQRPGQESVWEQLRSEQDRQTVKITSVGVPDGAPAPTASVAVVRVTYVLTTTPKSGKARQSNEEIALHLVLTADGWRVDALPWA